MSVQDSTKLYPGMGIPSNTVDSGAVVVSTTPKTITVTVPALADSTQPSVGHGQVAIALTAMNGAAVLGQIDISASDGTNTECIDSIPAAVAATAGRGGTFIRRVFSALVNITTIKSIIVVIATSANNNYTAEVVFNCGGQN